MIKYLDLKKINAEYGAEFQNSLGSFLDSGQYILSNQVEEFEAEFASYCGTKHCIGVGNGLDALTFILKGYINLGRLQKGDKVIVPANTFIATILSVLHAGLVPVLIEPDLETFNVSFAKIKENISSDIKAVIIVHLYGQLVSSLENLIEYSKENNLLLIEDAAQAHGAFHITTKKAGSFGHAAAFSFYPTKNLGALADAGAVTTSSDDLCRQIRLLRNYGSEENYNFERIGHNSRLDEIQASFLRIKLRNLDRDNIIRQNIARRYLAEIKNKKIILPFYSGKSDHIFYAFVIRLENRKDFLSYISNHKIEVNVHYPIPPHEQTALKGMVNPNLPITQKIHETVVSLPLNPTLSDSEIDKIIAVLNRY